MKLLLLDVETSPLTAYVWGLWDQNISHNHIIDNSYVMCWSARWLGSVDILFDSVMKSGRAVMLNKLFNLLDEADAVIHYNGKKFDIPVVNKEFLLMGWEPPSPYKQIDLLQTARRQFKFPSNKLDYIAKALNVGGKTEHAGFSLWVDCLAGKQEAWDKMEEYNKNDVILLEKVYYKLLPWIKNHPNVGLYNNTISCPNCGGVHLVKRGFAYTNTIKYQRYVCKDCGAWSRGKQGESIKEGVTSVGL